MGGSSGISGVGLAVGVTVGVGSKKIVLEIMRRYPMSIPPTMSIVTTLIIRANSLVSLFFRVRVVINKPINALARLTQTIVESSAGHVSAITVDANMATARLMKT